MAKTTSANERASLETLVEEGELQLDTLHPGGLEITRELAELCHIDRQSSVLDIASGTGESACFLTESFAARVTGVDAAPRMVKTARQKAAERKLRIDFARGDAHQLPFGDNRFDAAISECTTCILDKQLAIAEMVRVVKPGGFVGIHDLCWQPDTPVALKTQLIAIEGEAPETLHGWRMLFERAGLIDVEAVDRSTLIPIWTKGIRRQLGITGQLRIFLRVYRRWGLRGLKNILLSKQIFSSSHTGYGIIVGRKPHGYPTD